jgi:hypothetical protein
VPCEKGDVEDGSEEAGVDMTSDMSVKRSSAPIVKTGCCWKQCSCVAVAGCWRIENEMKKNSIAGVAQWCKRELDFGKRARDDRMVVIR